ncbi:hypothetical protein [Streptomyces sp. NPDC020951]|uniref:hypothetical protein n=1 Tax=Streptomyces sp. NPDC020951 TaxID=3365104 RepID=UPI00379D770F
MRTRTRPSAYNGAAVLYATHEPELTDFYAGLGFTLSPAGIDIPTPTGVICHGPSSGYRFSVKPLGVNGGSWGLAQVP